MKTTVERLREASRNSIPVFGYPCPTMPPVAPATRLLVLGSAIAIAYGASQVGPKVVKFSGGAVSVTAEKGGDRVVVTDSTGKVVADSLCEPGTYAQYFALFAALGDALARGERASVMKLVAYPFRVNADKPLVFRSADSLLKSYETVFTPSVLTKVRKAEPAAVFCRKGAAMLGDGVIWARPSSGGVAAWVLNP